MENQNSLNQLILRTMLLEGKNYTNMIAAVKTFNKEGKTDEARDVVKDLFKKEITRTAHDLLDDNEIDSLIDEISNQL